MWSITREANAPADVDGLTNSTGDSAVANGEVCGNGFRRVVISVDIFECSDSGCTSVKGIATRQTHTACRLPLFGDLGSARIKCLA